MAEIYIGNESVEWLDSKTKLPDKNKVITELSKIYSTLYKVNCTISSFRQWTAPNIGYAYYISITKDKKGLTKFLNEEDDTKRPEINLIISEMSKTFTTLYHKYCDIINFKRYGAIDSLYEDFYFYVKILKDNERLAPLVLTNGDKIKRRRTRSDKNKPKKDTKPSKDKPKDSYVHIPKLPKLVIPPVKEVPKTPKIKPKQKRKPRSDKGIPRGSYNNRKK